MGPVLFTKDGIAVDTSLAALFQGHRRYYPIPKNLLISKPKPPAPPPPPSASPQNLASDPAPTPATASNPALDPALAQPLALDSTPQSAEVVLIPWTEIQDAMLRGLKDYQHKTFREIGAMIDGRDAEDCRERYDELLDVAIAEKKAQEEEEAMIKNVEEQAMEETEMRTWWAVHKAEKAKETEAEQKAKEVEDEKEEAMATEKAKSEEIKNKAMIAENSRKEETKKEAKASRAEKRAQEKEARKEKSPTANSDKDRKGKKGNPRGRDKTTASGKNKGKGQEPLFKDKTSFKTSTKTSTITSTDERPVINLEILDEEEIEEAPLLWYLHNQSQEQKWKEMAARYFEATGQQVPVKMLEKKLKGMGI